VKQSFRKIISLFLLAIFVIASTPDEWIHSFADHHDTIDSNSPVTAVSARHIHCEALQLSLPSFSCSTSFHFSALPLSATSLYFDVKTLTLPFFALSPSGRAPPALA
jgi:hypothetical protein